MFGFLSLRAFRQEPMTAAAESPENPVLAEPNPCRPLRDPHPLIERAQFQCSGKDLVAGQILMLRVGVFGVARRRECRCSWAEWNCDGCRWKHDQASRARHRSADRDRRGVIWCFCATAKCFEFAEVWRIENGRLRSTPQ